MIQPSPFTLGSVKLEILTITVSRNISLSVFFNLTGTYTMVTMFKIPKKVLFSRKNSSFNDFSRKNDPKSPV